MCFTRKSKQVLDYYRFEFLSFIKYKRKIYMNEMGDSLVTLKSFNQIHKWHFASSSMSGRTGRRCIHREGTSNYFSWLHWRTN